MATAKKSSSKKKYSKKATTKIKKTMREYSKGTLHSGSKKGPKVKSRKQAVAIAISQARKEGAKVPKKTTAKKSSRKRTTTSRSRKK